MAGTNGNTVTANAGDAIPIIDHNGNDGVFDVELPISDGDGSPDSPRDPSVAAAKRGRGRPRKDGGAGAGTSHRSEKTGGGSEAVGKKPTKLDVGVFATQIVGVHKMLAAVTKNPMLEISPSEADSLAMALKNVMMYHSINISPSVLAYVQLIGVCMAVYGPRVAITMASMKAEKESKKQASTLHAV